MKGIARSLGEMKILVEMRFETSQDKTIPP